jgi:UDP-glucuronate decarboxylase
MIDGIISEDLNRIEMDFPDHFDGRYVLITGGAGFIGSWLCDAFLRKEMTVTVVDDLSTGDIANIDHLVKKSNFRFQRTKAEDLGSGEEVYDYVLHFASRPAPDDYQRHPVETALPNSLGSYRILEMARRCDAAVLFASSSEVYGQAEVIPTPEDYCGKVNALGPRGCYDESKRFGETLFMSYHQEYGLNIKIARIFNTYGPRLRSDGSYARVISRFIAQSLAGEPVTVYGDGSQTRSFCYVTDTIGALLKMLTLKDASTPINVGNPMETDIFHLAEEIIRLTGAKSSIVFRALPPDDPKRRCPDIVNARSLLGWEPRVSLQQGLRRTIDWYKMQQMRKNEYTG